jgi:hypothetical protein
MLMHMMIRAIVYAKTEQDAIEAGRKVFERKRQDSEHKEGRTCSSPWHPTGPIAPTRPAALPTPRSTTPEAAALISQGHSLVHVSARAKEQKPRIG